MSLGEVGGSRGATTNSVPRPRGRSFVPRAPRHQPRRPAPTLPAGKDRVSSGQDGVIAASGSQGSSSAVSKLLVQSTVIQKVVEYVSKIKYSLSSVHRAINSKLV